MAFDLAEFGVPFIVKECQPYHENDDEVSIQELAENFGDNIKFVSLSFLEEGMLFEKKPDVKKHQL